jgi:hypothetical protein
MTTKKKIGAIVLASVLGISGGFALTAEGSAFKEEFNKVLQKYDKKEEDQVLQDLNLFNCMLTRLPKLNRMIY